MSNDTRSRKPADHMRALGFSLDAAELNQRILTQSASDREIFALMKGPLSHAIRSAVVQALRAAALHVEDLSTVSVWGTSARPSDDELANRTDAIRALGRQLHELSAEGMTRSIRHSEFENIRGQLLKLGFALKPEHVLDLGRLTT